MNLSSVPNELMRSFIFKYLNSNEIFRLRCINKNLNELVRVSWADVVREEMMQQMSNMDYLCEKNTTTKLLEFKLRYLMSYASLMQRYFNHMNLMIISEASRNADPELKLILLLACTVLCSHISSWSEAEVFIQSELFEISLRLFSNALSPPLRSLEDLRALKSQLPALIDAENSTKLIMHSWVDGAFEFNILKHEICELEERYNRVMAKIQDIATSWPRKKLFIEKAYKIMTLAKLKDLNMPDQLEGTVVERLDKLLESLNKMRED
mmetsp:Transcript_26295/g.47126  ORF Transcript_26295/g.47126 Transcript_26295/m.47126 type:complete len:267 (+) Transcript_26295:21-821(+)